MITTLNRCIKNINFLLVVTPLNKTKYLSPNFVIADFFCIEDSVYFFEEKIAMVMYFYLFYLLWRLKKLAFSTWEKFLKL